MPEKKDEFYFPKYNKKNEDDAKYCSKCGTNLNSIKNSYNTTQIKNTSFEKQVEDFVEEIGQLGKKAGKIIVFNSIDNCCSPGGDVIISPNFFI
jgi:hypothetical protein